MLRDAAIVACLVAFVLSVALVAIGIVGVNARNRWDRRGET